MPTKSGIEIVVQLCTITILESQLPLEEEFSTFLVKTKKKTNLQIGRLYLATKVLIKSGTDILAQSCIVTILESQLLLEEEFSTFLVKTKKKTMTLHGNCRFCNKRYTVKKNGDLRRHNCESSPPPDAEIGSIDGDSGQEPSLTDVTANDLDGDNDSVASGSAAVVAAGAAADDDDDDGDADGDAADADGDAADADGDADDDDDDEDDVDDDGDADADGDADGDDDDDDDDGDGDADQDIPSIYTWAGSGGEDADLREQTTLILRNGKFLWGRVTGRNVAGEVWVTFSSSRQNPALCSAAEARASLLPADPTGLHTRKQNRPNKMDHILTKYTSTRNTMIERELTGMRSLGEEDATIRLWCDLRPETHIKPDVTRKKTKTLIKQIQDHLAGGAIHGGPVRLILETAMKTLRYLGERAELNSQLRSSMSTAAPSLRPDFPEVGSAAPEGRAQAPEVLPIGNPGEGNPREEALWAQIQEDDLPLNPRGTDAPLEPTDPTARRADGLLVNDWRSVDALHLRMAMICPFKTLRYVPKSCWPLVREAYKTLANRLLASISLPDTHPGRSNTRRRAVFWYMIFPGLCLRDPADRDYSKNTRIIERRLLQLINGDLGNLINEWDRDYRKAETKPRHPQRDTKDKREKKAINLIKYGTPHGISRALAQLRGNGVATCDNPAIEAQMVSKHPTEDADWSSITPDIIARGGKIKMTNLAKILDSVDPEKGAGPRGHNECINLCIARGTPLKSPEGATALAIFENLGVEILSRTVPWISGLLRGSLLTPLLKNPQGPDARPVNAQDRDVAAWTKAANQTIQATVRKACGTDQLGVGVSSGCQVLVWGLKLTIEQHERDHKPLTLTKRDINNAHNTFLRQPLLENLIHMEESDASIKPVLALAAGLLPVKTQIYTRTLAPGPGLRSLCECDTGGEQGAATTNSFYPLSIKPALSKTLAEHPSIGMKAFQDDMTPWGRARDLFGPRGALQSLEAHLRPTGGTFKPSKDRAWSNGLEGERDLIPDHFLQPHLEVKGPDGSTTRAYGMEIVGSPLGDEAYIREWLRLRAEEIAAEIDSVSEKISRRDPHCSYATTYYSLQTWADYIMSTNYPSQTASFAGTVNAAIRRAFGRSLQIDLLDPSISEDPEDPEPLRDPLLISDRAQLRASQGGAGLRLLDSREHFLNCMHNVLPQLINSKDRSGETTQGFFDKELKDLLGEGSFDEENAQARYRHFLNHGGRCAREFTDQYELGREIHTDLHSKMDRPLPPESIYNTPIEGFGAAHPKLQLKITDERQQLRALVLHKRMEALPQHDPRGKAYHATRGNPFANTLFGSLPNPAVPMNSPEWTTAAAIHMGVPINALNHRLGEPIRNHANCRQLHVDRYGYNLSAATGVTGGHIQRNHGEAIAVVSQALAAAGIHHKGGNSDTSPKLIFHTAMTPSAIEVTNTQHTKEINSIVPDLVIDASGPHLGDTSLGRATHVVDFKTMSGRHEYYDELLPMGSAANRRQEDVSADYYSTAKRLDSRLHGTSEGDAPGPFVKVLLNLGGENHLVLGPTVGFYGEGSEHLEMLRDLVCAGLAGRHRSHIRNSPETSIGLHRFLLNHKWGHTFKRGWARVILSRLQEHTGPLTHGHGHADSDDPRATRDAYHFFKPGHRQAGGRWRRGRA